MKFSSTLKSTIHLYAKFEESTDLCLFSLANNISKHEIASFSYPLSPMNSHSDSTPLNSLPRISNEVTKVDFGQLYLSIEDSVSNIYFI